MSNQSQLLITFTRLLLALLNSGVPILQSFVILIKNQPNPAFCLIITNIHQRLLAGESLNQALQKHPSYFSTFYYRLVAVGEKTGTLRLVLNELLAYLEKERDLKHQLAQALIYPTIVLVFSVLISIALMLFIIPQFEVLYKTLNISLPYLTQIFITLSQGFQSWFLWLSVSGVLVFAKRYYQQLIWALPIIKQMLHQLNNLIFSRSLATILKAGLPLMEALDLVSEAMPHSLYQQAIKQLRLEIKTGLTLHEAMKKNKLFSALTVEMIAIAEQSGTLDSMLEKTAHFNETELQYKLNGFQRWLEPSLILILGGLISLLVLAMYLPMIHLGAGF